MVIFNVLRRAQAAQHKMLSFQDDLLVQAQGPGDQECHSGGMFSISTLLGYVLWAALSVGADSLFVYPVLDRDHVGRQ